MTLLNDVMEILHNPLDHQWTLQGFGMLRLYLDDEEVRRLHIWDPDMANADVSTIHNHPWDFTSEIMIGALANQRYLITNGPPTHMLGEIRTGEGGGRLDDDPAFVTLESQRMEIYRPGDSYSQTADEIHESFPGSGTTTVITRKFTKPRDHARVCWPVGTPWVTAEPRPATEAEIRHFVRLALLALDHARGY